MGDRVWHSPWSIFRKTLLSPRISFSYSSYCTRSGTRLLCFALLTYNCNYTATHAHCAVQEEFHVWRALNGIQGKGRQATRLSAVARSIALTCLASTLPVLPKQCLTARSVAILSWFSGLYSFSPSKSSLQAIADRNLFRHPADSEIRLFILPAISWRNLLRRSQISKSST